MSLPNPTVIGALSVTPDANALTADTVCRALLGVDIEVFVKELQIHGIDHLLNQLEEETAL